MGGGERKGPIPVQKGLQHSNTKPEDTVRSPISAGRKEGAIRAAHKKGTMFFCWKKRGEAPYSPLWNETEEMKLYGDKAISRVEKKGGTGIFTQRRERGKKGLLKKGGGRKGRACPEIRIKIPCDYFQRKLEQEPRERRGLSWLLGGREKGGEVRRFRNRPGGTESKKGCDSTRAS